MGVLMGEKLLEQGWQRKGWWFQTNRLMLLFLWITIFTDCHVLVRQNKRCSGLVLKNREIRWGKGKGNLGFKLLLSWQPSMCEKISVRLNARCISWAEGDLRVMATERIISLPSRWQKRENLPWSEPYSPLESVEGVTKVVLQTKSRDVKHCVKEAWKWRETTGFL